MSIFAAHACNGLNLELALGSAELLGNGVGVVETVGLALPVGDVPPQAVTQTTAIAAATLARMTL